MKFENDYTSFYYEFINNSKKINTIILPGWMNNTTTYKPLFETIGKFSNIYIINFPGFKISPNPSSSVNLDYYVKLLKDFIDYLNIDKVILFGHSFGGRVSIKYEAIYGNSLFLILTSSAGIRRFSLKRSCLIHLFKLKKNILKAINKSKYIELIQNSGSRDYNSLDHTMKKTFINIVNEDLKEYCLRIKTPTLLLWGENDQETKLKDGKLMNKLIKSSSLVVIKNAGHFPFIDNFYQYQLVLISFYEYIMEELLLN